MRLAGKVAIVTGGAKGIGEVYSTGLAEEGASLESLLDRCGKEE